MEKLRVKPTKENRKSFGRWAHRNKVKTVSPSEFYVPANLISKIPESLLIGATIDSQLYIPKKPYTIQPVNEVKNDLVGYSVPTPKDVAPLDNNKKEPDVTPIVVPEERHDVFGSLAEQEQEEEEVQEETVSFLPQDVLEEEEESSDLYCAECAIEFSEIRGLNIHKAYKHPNG